MVSYRKASMTLAIFLAVPLFELPAAAAGNPDWPSAQRHADHFRKAKALADPITSTLSDAPRPLPTDGLSRNDEDCNYGCIDH